MENVEDIRAVEDTEAVEDTGNIEDVKGSTVKDYYVGLDIGTSSVGWAVTDLDYNLVHRKGKDLWGSYLFPEADTAEERRTFRDDRRRVGRIHQRLMLLQSLFAEEIGKTDPLFFLRLNNSSFRKEDKDGRLSGVDALFGDKGFGDREYFRKYPTIYHLRSALVHGEEVTDVRLLYLAVHHILKHRGHFLLNSKSAGSDGDDGVRRSFTGMNSWIQDNGAEGMQTLETESLADVLNILSDSSMGCREKYNSLVSVYGVAKKARSASDASAQNIIKAICGLSFDVRKVFCLSNRRSSDMKNLSFGSPAFDDLLPDIADELGEDMAAFICILESIYGWSVFEHIMNGHAYISDSKVESYEKHRQDLARLKKYVRENCPGRYKTVFRRQFSRLKGDKVCNYAAYIGMDDKKGFAKCTKEEFYKFLRNSIKVDDEYLLSEMDKGTFMPLQRTRDNALIPYQAHLKELNAILDNAEKHFPFLDSVEDGLSVRDRIVRLMTFHVPYFVGPLKGPHSFARFVEGKENTKVTPWNFDEVIDLNASEEVFIGTRTGKCTYLPDQDELPAASFLYSEFVFLDELNNLRFNGEKDARIKQFIYGYAKTHKKVTLDACRKAMTEQGIIPADTVIDQFTGLNGDFKSSLKSYNDFAFLGDRRDANPEMCEDIIRWITVISDKNRLQSRIRERYGSVLSSDEITKLSGLRYSGWGKLSKELLSGIKSPVCVNENGECMSVIERMRESEGNFMQIYYKEGFADVVKERNRSLFSDKVTYKTVHDMYCSPSVKRSIWRSLELVREIMKICGGQPRKIFVEMDRETCDAATPLWNIPRKNQVLSFYKKLEANNLLGMDVDSWLKEIEGIPARMFDSDRLFLYFLQGGRCMYTGKEIRLADVFNTNLYDIDHIYPRSKVKDDSFSNRVLVLKTENERKGDVYPVASEMRDRMRPYWEKLAELGMISHEKFFRLIRATEFTEEELIEFINRQLVFTRQSTKHVAELLGKVMPGTEVVYAKADNTVDFRSENGIIKIRELNDLHHAKDAYINIVVGNVYNTKFGHDAAVYFKEHHASSVNLTTLFDYDIKGAWSPSYKERIIKTAEKNTCAVVHMVTSGHGEMFNQLIIPAKSSDALMPVKDKEPFQATHYYGGYNSVKSYTFMIVRSKDYHGKDMISVEGYPLQYAKRYGNSTESKMRFCVEEAGLKDPVILLDNLKKGFLICNGSSYAIVMYSDRAKGSILCNANQLCLDEKSMATLKEVCKYKERCIKYSNFNTYVQKSLTSEDMLLLYDVFTDKLSLPIYHNLWARLDFAKHLRDKRELFISFTKEQQATLLYEILHLMQCKPVSLADLSLLGLGNHTGHISIRRNIANLDLKIIFRSPTGFYTHIIRVQDLLKS